MSTRTLIASSGVKLRPVPPGHTFIGTDTDDGVLYVGYGAGTFPHPITGGAELITAVPTVTGNDNGKTFIINTTTATVVPIPAAASLPAGFTFTVAVLLLPAAAEHGVDPVAADTIVFAGVTTTAGTVLNLSDASDRVGDFITLTSDGVSNWIVTASAGTWAQ